MTWISNEHKPTGYDVLEFPRGPQMGIARFVTTRQWIAECHECDTHFDGRTRPGAAERLATHFRQRHHGRRDAS